MSGMRLGLWLAAVSEDVFYYKITKYKFLFSSVQLLNRVQLFVTP